MFNDKDKDGWIKGTEVVSYNGLNWLIVGEGKHRITIENDFSYDPSYREYSSATMMYASVDYIVDLDYSELKPFATIIMKKGTDEEWNKVYKSLGLME
jgi:hypothetical protein